MLQPADVSPPNPRKPHIQTPGGSTPSDRPRSSDGSSERSGSMTPGPGETHLPLLQPNGESSRYTGSLCLCAPLSSH